MDRGCTWGDLSNRTLHVFATKPGRARDIDVVAPLAEDLASPMPTGVDDAGLEPATSALSRQDSPDHGGQLELW
jgi:hypothetical protein